MRNTFPGYYRPTEEKFKLLWDECLFVIDANVLLNLYRYSQRTRDELLEVLSQISDRLWIPYQAAFEYQESRLNVIAQQLEAYDKLQDLVNNFKSGLYALRRHSFLDVDGLLKLIAKFEKKLGSLKEKHPDFLTEDKLRDSITSILNGKVGKSYSQEKLEEIYREGEERYKQKIPPGHKDGEKDSVKRYGDLIIWFQLIDRAKETKKSIIFVTDDKKDDWWLKFKGKTVGPRPELIHEMRSKADVQFYMYQADPFLEHAQNYLKRQIKKETIDEVRGIRLNDEKELETKSKAVLPEEIFQKIGATALTGLSKESLEAIEKSASVLKAEDLLRNHGITQERISEVKEIFDQYKILASTIPAGTMEFMKEINEAAAKMPVIQLPDLSVYGKTLSENWKAAIHEIPKLELTKTFKTMQEAAKIASEQYKQLINSIQEVVRRSQEDIQSRLLLYNAKPGESAKEDKSSEPIEEINKKRKEPDNDKEPNGEK